MAKFVCMSFKGDWKYLKQIFNLKRNMNAPKLCFACLAEKEGYMNMTNISQDAPWRETIWNCPLPWRDRPALAYLDFFHIRKISYDMLHVWHLGIGRDLILACKHILLFAKKKGRKVTPFLARPCFNQIRIGGCMHELIRCGYFGVGGVKLRLQRATTSLRRFCKTIRKRTALHKFSQDNLCLKKGQFPETLLLDLCDAFSFKLFSPV